MGQDGTGRPGHGQRQDKTKTAKVPDGQVPTARAYNTTWAISRCPSVPSVSSPALLQSDCGVLVVISLGEPWPPTDIASRS
jgi:hypothetical protein